MISALLLTTYYLQSGCALRIHVWTSVCMAFMGIEKAEAEIRDRMNQSTYWDERRKLRKFLTDYLIVSSELVQFVWWFYG